MRLVVPLLFALGCSSSSSESSCADAQANGACWSDWECVVATCASAAPCCSPGQAYSRLELARYTCLVETGRAPPESCGRSPFDCFCPTRFSERLVAKCVSGHCEAVAEALDGGTP